MAYTRPEPTTLPPDIRPISLSPPSLKKYCKYCGREVFESGDTCSHCGAPVKESEQ